MRADAVADDTLCLDGVTSGLVTTAGASVADVDGPAGPAAAR